MEKTIIELANEIHNAYKEAGNKVLLVIVDRDETRIHLKPDAFFELFPYGYQKIDEGDYIRCRDHMDGVTYFCLV